MNFHRSLYGYGWGQYPPEAREKHEKKINLTIRSATMTEEQRQQIEAKLQAFADEMINALVCNQLV